MDVVEAQKGYFDNYYKYSCNEAKGTFGFSIGNYPLPKSGEGSPTEERLDVEQVLGQYLEYFKNLAKKQSKKGMKDVVITVPPYAGFKYRLALRDAVRLADLNPLAFIHENTAAALYLGINRMDNETKKMIFYNMGSSSLKVSLVEFHAIKNKGKQKRKFPMIETVTVLDEEWDESVNG